MCPFLAQAVRFELTCLYGKLISSQPRYDHFDTLAYLVRLEENPLDFPLDKVLKIERQEAMKPDGKRVCQNAVSDISARFRATPLQPLEYFSVYEIVNMILPLVSISQK